MSGFPHVRQVLPPLSRCRKGGSGEVIKNKGKISNLFYKTNITLIPKPQKDEYKKGKL